jgi:hypothetical protein
MLLRERPMKYLKKEEAPPLLAVRRDLAQLETRFRSALECCEELRAACEPRVDRWQWANGAVYAYTYNDPTDRADPTGEDFGAAVFFDSWYINLHRAYDIAQEELLKWSGHHNDVGDAMRHAEWSNRMSTEVGVSTALVVGVGHELDGMIHGQPAAEFYMDMNNNREGRHAAEEQRPINTANLITNTDSADANKKQYVGGVVGSSGAAKTGNTVGAALVSGKTVNVGSNNMTYNNNSGKATTTTTL